MINLILLLIIAALFIQGWDYATQYDPQWHPTVDLENRNPFGDYATNKEVLWFFRYYIGQALFSCGMMWFAKPLFTCRICMASVYGTIIFWSYNFVHPFHYSVVVWIVFCFTLAGLNRIILRLF